MMLTTEICDSIAGSVRLAWRGVGWGGGLCLPGQCCAHLTVLFVSVKLPIMLK